MNNYFKLFTFTLFLTVSSSLYAEADKGFVFGIHGESVSLQAHEFVYIGNQKASELIWDTKQAYLIGADASILLGSSKRIKLSASVSATVEKQDSVMDDYDWFVAGSDWTHWSHHNNTSLQKGLVFDVNFSTPVYTNSFNSFKLNMLLGFKRDQWGWQAIGGNYIYSSGPNALRDTVGIFPDIPVISYEQTIESPYVGLVIDWKKENISFGAKVIASTLVTAKAVDHHYLRDLVFTDSFKGGKMFGASATFAYQLVKNTELTATYSVQNYLHNTGSTMIYDQVTGQTAFSSGGAGMSLSYQTLRVGLVSAF